MGISICNGRDPKKTIVIIMMMMMMMMMMQEFLLGQWVKHLTAGVPILVQRLMNPISIHEDEGSIPALLSGLRIRCCHELW